MRRLLLVLVSAGMALVGCGDDGADQTVDGTAPVETGTPILDDEDGYLLLDDPYWGLQEAVDYRPDNPLATVQTPQVDWFVEYDHYDERGDVDFGENVSIAALLAPIDQAESTLERFGFVFDGVDTSPWSAIGGSMPSEPDGANIVLVDGGPLTVQVLSHDLDVDALAAIASALTPVDRAGWIAAGGLLDV